MEEETRNSVLQGSKTPEKGTQKHVLQNIKTPLQLGALLLIVIETLIGALIVKLDPADALLGIVLMIVVLVIGIVGILLITKPKFQEANASIIPPAGTVADPTVKHEYDLFLAAPMSALGGQDFISVNKTMKNIKKLLKDKYGYKVFYAGSGMQTQDDFDTVNLSLKDDLEALMHSDKFMMIYPEKIVSSVIVEAGMALALGKPSYYFGKADNYPFLLKEAQSDPKYPYVKLYEIDSVEDVERIIIESKENILA